MIRFHNQATLALIAVSACLSSTSWAKSHTGLAQPLDDGQPTTRSLQVREFRAVDLAGCNSMAIHLGPEFRLTATGIARDLDTLRVSLLNERLGVDRTELGCTPALHLIRLDLTVPELDAVSISNAGRMFLPAISGERLTARLTGAASLDLAGLRANQVQIASSGAGRVTIRDANVKRLALQMSGVSRFEATGRADLFEIESDGKSVIDAYRLTASTLNLKAQGFSDIRANAQHIAGITTDGSPQIDIQGVAFCSSDVHYSTTTTCSQADKE